MADREQSQTSKRGMDEKPQRDTAGKIGQAHGGGAKSGGTVGRDVPDESKERHTEIAVEAGRQGKHPEDKPADKR
jgi:hypothetical protein